MLNDSGLSLLEVLVAMIVLSLGVLGLAPLVVMSIEGNNISSDVLTVSSMAVEKLEYYEALEALPATPFIEEETDLEGGYSRVTTIRDDSDPDVPEGLCQVDVTINWTDKSGVERSSTYSTLLRKG